MDNLLKGMRSMSLSNRPASYKKNTRKRGFNMRNVRGLSKRRSLTAAQKARLRVTKPSVARAIQTARSERR